jgi:hypothetical protein
MKKIQVHLYISMGHQQIWNEMHPLRAGVGFSVPYIKHEEDLGALVYLNGAWPMKQGWLIQLSCS